MSANTTDINALFARASREKVRFSTNKGPLGVEDLWDLSLESLDRLAMALHEGLQKQEGRTSFIGAQAPAKVTVELQTQFDLVKHVIDVKMAERDAAKQNAERLAQIAFLRSLQDKKQLEALESMSAEDIAKKLAELGA